MESLSKKNTNNSKTINTTQIAVDSCYASILVVLIAAMLQIGVVCESDVSAYPLQGCNLRPELCLIVL